MSEELATRCKEFGHEVLQFVVLRREEKPEPPSPDLAEADMLGAQDAYGKKFAAFSSHTRAQWDRLFAAKALVLLEDLTASGAELPVHLNESTIRFGGINDLVLEELGQSFLAVGEQLTPG
jgi:hypothetical protein